MDIVWCANHEGGCKWIGQEKHLAEDHANRCNFRRIICSCCNVTIPKGYYYSHILHCCRNRMDGSHHDEWLSSLDPCPNSHLGCKWRGTPAMLIKVHQFQCNKEFKPCAVCGEICLKGQLSSHILNDCSLRLSHVEGTFGDGICTFNAKSIEEKMDTTEPNEEKAMDVDE
ncbi:uncharacterized protein LOC116289274 isoform X2 [Actinia tenebrosa]|nr:uncharacterized protein LOC116289274 isoform X2 [Actinia tenebrosa]